MRPRVRAVRRLIANSNLVGACTGRSAAFSPFKIRWIYPGRLPELIDRVWPIGQQPTGRDKVTIGVNRRERMTCSEGSKPFSLGSSERTAKHNQSALTPYSHGPGRLFNFGNVPHINS